MRSREYCEIVGSSPASGGLATSFVPVLARIAEALNPIDSVGQRVRARPTLSPLSNRDPSANLAVGLMPPPTIAIEIVRSVGPSPCARASPDQSARTRSEEHTSELQSRGQLVCRLLLEKKQEIQH